MKKVVTAVKLQKERKEDNAGLFIPAGLCIGLGIGFLFDQIPGGALLGLGLGFVGLALSKILSSK